MTAADPDHLWGNLENKLDAAITEIMFSDFSFGAPTLGVLLSMFRQPGDVPGRAAERASRLLEIVERRAGTDLGTALRALSRDERRELGDELIGLLRFVCHRGRHG